VNADMFRYTGLKTVFGMTWQDLYMNGNKAKNATGSGIYIEDHVYDGMILNCWIEHFRARCVHLGNAWGWRIIGNIFEYAGEYALYIVGTDVRIALNKLLYNYKGIYGAIGRSSVIGNYFYLNDREALRLTSGNHSVILGNNFYVNGNEAAATYYHIVMDANVNYLKVISNGFDGGDKTRGAIQLGADCDHNYIALNTFGAHTASPISDSGTDTVVKHNGGYITENRGTTTLNGDGSTVTFTIPHGLTAAPTCFLALKAIASLPGIDYVGADATKISVTFTSAPASGTGNVVLTWYAQV